MRMTTKLRELIRGDKLPWNVAVYDGLTAKIAAEAGFDVVSSGGTAIAASLGLPDVELYSVTENLNATRNIVSASGIPVIADIDTGYGNALNVMRTVREFEQIGVAAVQLEDQVSPKRCPALGEAEILPFEDAVGKVRAAVAARRDPDLVIIARTDATDVEEACRRTRAFAEVGADMVFTVNKCCSSYDDLRRIREAAGVPIKLHMMGWVEDLTYEQIRSVAGCAGWGFPALLTVVKALQTNMAALLSTKSSKNLPIATPPWADFVKFIGYPEIERLSAEFIPQHAAHAD
jgi:methylisocitrate lyase